VHTRGKRPPGGESAVAVRWHTGHRGAHLPGAGATRTKDIKLGCVGHSKRVPALDAPGECNTVTETPVKMAGMKKLCILENDDLAPEVEPLYQGYGAMVERLFRQAGADDWTFEVFHTPRQEYPSDFASYDAVLLTGSKADSFSDTPWIVTLRAQVTRLLEQKKKLLGICFGHQLIALCLALRSAVLRRAGASVGCATTGMPPICRWHPRRATWPCW